ncbi:MAG: hypothetical protein OYM47_17050 [Gemmatimonadota bacterium]|nr:hypothetical protein [Gemmatimonadota bacterium]
MKATDKVLFPAFEDYAKGTGLLANARGILAARLPRILGQGKTRADGLDIPPARIERQQELAALALPKESVLGPAAAREIEQAKLAVKQHAERMRHPENRRRFALQALSHLKGVRTGYRDNQFFAGRLVLVSDKGGQNWAWSMTPHYPVIDKIPADIDYVVGGFKTADEAVEKWTLPVDDFLERLAFAWTMARHRTGNDNVLIADVARLFKIAVQSQRFWGRPSRRNFEDVPEAVFIANLINWRRQISSLGQSNSFELIPATLNQAHGTKSRSFFVPANAEGTVVRPMIYIRRKVVR